MRDKAKERMYNALSLAALQFRRYEAEHGAKAKADGIFGSPAQYVLDQKAETNRHFAELCEGAAEASVE